MLPHAIPFSRAVSFGSVRAPRRTADLEARRGATTVDLPPPQEARSYSTGKSRKYCLPERTARVPSTRWPSATRRSPNPKGTPDQSGESRSRRPHRQLHSRPGGSRSPGHPVAPRKRTSWRWDQLVHQNTQVDKIRGDSTTSSISVSTVADGEGAPPKDQLRQIVPQAWPGAPHR